MLSCSIAGRRRQEKLGKRGIEKRRMIEGCPTLSFVLNGHLLRFQPTPFVIPEGGISVIGLSVFKYVDLKAKKLEFRVKLF